MKYVFVFLAIYLLATGFAAHGKSKLGTSDSATRKASASLKRLSSTKLGKTLIDTIQIELKANTEVDPRPRILQLLNEIQDETYGQIQNLNDNIAAVRDDCSSTQNQLASDINDLNSQIEAETIEQAAVSADLANLQDQYSAAVSLGQAYQAQLDALNTLRAERQAAYEHENARLQKIRSVLEQTRAFISDRLDQRQNPSFLQRNNVLIEVKRKVMSKEFQAAAPGWGKFINFLATKALSKLKDSPDEQAENGLSNIINVIDDLQDNNNQNILARNAAEQSEVAAYESAKSNLEDVITTTNAQIASLELNIGLDQDRLTSLTAALENNNAILVNKQADLEASQQSCHQKEEEYSEAFSQRTQEAEVIQEVKQIIENHLTNLNAAVESVINSAKVSDE